MCVRAVVTVVTLSTLLNSQPPAQILPRRSIFCFSKSQRGLGKSSDNILPCRNSPSQQGFGNPSKAKHEHSRCVCVWWWVEVVVGRLTFGLDLLSQKWSLVWLCFQFSSQFASAGHRAARNAFLCGGRLTVSTEGLNLQETCFHRHGS